MKGPRHADCWRRRIIADHDSSGALGNKDSHATEVFMTIRHAYEVLSNEVTRIRYDRALTCQEDVGRSYKGKWNHSPNFEDGVRLHRWKNARRKIPKTKGVLSFTKKPMTRMKKKTGSRFSLTFRSLMALLDKKLDAGYKIGYVIAWVSGGRGGVLLTLCPSFACWVCGKSSGLKKGKKRSN
ncbi:uncharacterized protein LOC120186029 [Hibiscus syriacus]|uniref:uncharacterized protein LOC120186029 n=1 Tax=Hibiscus syriacus TaxID=106335 RepID=UPI001922A4FC|nr:uncharacterized protein LOC120186029 [Hibiscus syriacus]